MAHHKREKGQSKQRYRLKGGAHFRGSTLIERGDTLHLTKSEYNNHRDKFEVVTDTPDEPEFDAADEEPQEEPDEGPQEEPDADDEPDADEEDGGGLTREDFASDKSYREWIDGGMPDLSEIERTGHGGETYKADDVRKAL